MKHDPKKSKTSAHTLKWTLKKLIARDFQQNTLFAAGPRALA
jgi:hypothetical protein